MKPAFDTSVVQQQPQTQKLAQVVNYIWINKEKFVPQPDGPTCGVPLHYVDKALKNAIRYPNAEFNIWLDTSLLDRKSIDILEEHIRKIGAQNVTVQSLQDIKDYRESALFNSSANLAEDQGNIILVCADLARLLVLKHVIEAAEYDYVFYSDLDVPDIGIDDVEMLNTLQCCDVVTGKCVGECVSSEGMERKFYPENGFIGFYRNASGFNLLQKIISETKNEIFQFGQDGYQPFTRVLRERARVQGHDFEDYYIPGPILPPMGQIIPKPLKYEGLCI